MTPTALQNDVNQIISSLTIKELESLFKTHEKLNPRGKKETQADWIKKFEPRKAQIISWAEYFYKKIEYLSQTYSISKTNAQGQLARYLRKRQEKELGYTHSLINPVKISLICNLEKHLNVGTSTTTTATTTTSTTLAKPKIAKVNKQRPKTPSQVKTNPKTSKSLKGFTIKSLRSKGNSVFGTLINSSVTPFQNLKLKVFSKKNVLKIKNCSGENFQLAAGMIHIPFLFASMSSTPKTVNFKFDIDGYLNGDEDLVLSLNVDDPASKQIISDNFPIQSF